MTSSGLKHTPCWMESGRRTESGVPVAIMEGRHQGNRLSRLRFARKMAERKQRAEELKKEQELADWRRRRQEVKDRGLAMIKRPPMTSVQKQYGVRRVG